MTESEHKKFSFYFFKIFQIPEAEVIIFLSHLSSQKRKTSVLVLFKILVCPTISSPSPVYNPDWALKIGMHDGKKRKSVMKVNSVMGLLLAVESGVGLAALPEYLVTNSNNVIKVLPKVEGPITEAHFVYPQSLKNKGMKLENTKSSNIKSEGLIKGVIQVPGDGNPIIMLSDHGTIGGYPKIGVIISADYDRLVQIPPGSSIKFQQIELSDAETLFKMYEMNTQSLLSQI